MDLDDRDYMKSIDRANMIVDIDAFADQLDRAWALALSCPLPDAYHHPHQIVLCGMGGSAIGGDLVAALVSRTSQVPFIVLREYVLPAYVSGPDTLVIANSFSGNTEETLSAAEQALERGVHLLAIATGGQLATHANTHNYPLWQFDQKGQPRAALGWSLGLLIGLVHRLGLAPTLEADLKEAVTLLRAERQVFGVDSPLGRNPAKRGAGQLVGRIPVFYGGGLFEPVARRWKCQLNENAKVWAQYEPLPEANHNTVVGIDFPEERMMNMNAVFISSKQFNHPRVYLRHKLTHQLYLQNGIMVDTFHPKGDSALAQMCHAVQYGDYLSYYAAMAYGADPSTIAPIVELKTQLAQHDG
jgi:glucose/mannose-6-phosphate isomerase